MKQPWARRPSDMSYEELDAFAAEPYVSICWSCNRIENAWEWIYQSCCECGHVYLTVHDLQDAFKREFNRDPPPGDQIFFCLECGHDW